MFETHCCLILTFTLFISHVECLEGERVTEESYIFLLADTQLWVSQRGLKLFTRSIYTTYTNTHTHLSYSFGPTGVGNPRERLMWQAGPILNQNKTG